MTDSLPPDTGNATTDDLEYLLGSEPGELARLGFQHRVFAEVSARLWRLAGFVPGHSIADLGCGPGFASLDLAYLVGEQGRVLAVDDSRRFLDHLDEEASRHGLEQLEIQQADLARVTLPDSSFDGVYARWLFCFLEHPQRLIEQVARSLRPGGKLVVLDYFNYSATSLWPTDPAVPPVLEAVAESWRRSGGSLEVGGQLPQWCEASGLQVTHLAQGSRLARPGDALWQWPKRFFRGYLPKLEEAGLLSAEQVMAFERVWREREQTPGSFFMSPPMVELIAQKA